MLSVGIVVVVFAGILPRVADYSSVWHTMTSLTFVDVVTLVAAAVTHFAANWPQLAAALPGLSLGQAAVANQASTTVANTLPGGGMFSVGLIYGMFRSWGFADPAIALSILICFVWNSFAKLGLPMIAFLALVVQGRGITGLLAASIVGVAVIALASAFLALYRWKKNVAVGVASLIGWIASFVRRIFHKPRFSGWADAAVRFRTEAIRIVEARWVALTTSTLAVHLSLYAVLLLAVRYVGISGREIGWAQVLGVFAIARLLTAFPITPGGLGIMDLGCIGGLILAGQHRADVPLAEFRAEVTAAVLVFRTLTYGLQIPFGGLAYVIWRRKKGWGGSKPVPHALAADSPIDEPPLG
ncbi:MAG: lysylphosphatidylglycerol synthase transmembrane domain-containing protein [Actinomycetota bacterium]